MGEWVNWFPIVVLPLKLIVLGWGMFHAIKWHHDQDKKKKNELSKAPSGRQESISD